MSRKGTWPKARVGAVEVPDWFREMMLEKIEIGVEKLSRTNGTGAEGWLECVMPMKLDMADPDWSVLGQWFRTMVGTPCGVDANECALDKLDMCHGDARRMGFEIIASNDDEWRWLTQLWKEKIAELRRKEKHAVRA